MCVKTKNSSNSTTTSRNKEELTFPDEKPLNLSHLAFDKKNNNTRMI